VLAGLWAWSRRPRNRTGALLCLGGFTLLLAALQNTDVPGLVAVGLTLVLALRLRAATASQRRVLAVLYGYGIFAILFLELAANVLPPLFGFGPITMFVLQISAAAGIPIAFTVGVLSGRFARTAEIEELGMWLGARTFSILRWSPRCSTGHGDRATGSTG
jgi:hypothetical protein